ncbi:MAG: hypothetical protein K1X67_11650 [Fimbriimonadaceae bacterium]|nr:hypothetical protein [Fimbriimonadaceae bacterium]
MFLPAIWLATQAETRFEPAQLQADLQVMKRVMTALHPGLTRYLTPTQLDEQWAKLGRLFEKPLNAREVYLSLSRFTGSLRCGHSYVNFYNQSDDLKRVVFNGNDKVPFTFLLVGDRMLVEKSATPEVKAGDEITEIGGKSISSIIKELLPFVKADGSNDGKRRYDLQISGAGEFETFDIFFPLMFPPDDGKYAVKVNGSAKAVILNTISRKDRKEKLKISESGDPVADSWSDKILPDGTAYLQVGTFAIWKWKVDWKTKLDDFFTSLQTEKRERLVIDLRGNEGGADEVGSQILSYLTPKYLPSAAAIKKIRFDKVPEDLRPYLNTWDPSFYDFSKSVKPSEDGMFFLNEFELRSGVSPRENRFAGQVAILIDAGNSSATFYLARAAKANTLAILVGSTTGGNLRGLNGDKFFFFTLPNTKIEIDIPIVANYLDTNAPDSGLEPDVSVSPTLDDVRAGRDVVLEKAVEVLKKTG